MNLFANGISLDLALDILRRRFWIAVALFSLVATAVVSLAVFLPNIYTASAFILVEGQQIPQDYVRSTVTLGVERRLQMISQEILSRSKLEQLASQFGLYRELKRKNPSGEMIAATMRRDIGIQIKGRGSSIGSDTVAFEVSYTGPSPEKVTQVVNTLASFYIEENLKVREQQALGTSEFLRAELERVKRKLEDQEQKVVQYRQEHAGELPGQFQANLSTLSMLQKQMEILSSNLAQAQERRSALMRRVIDATAAASGGATNPDREVLSLEALKARLAQLRIRFSDKHPDVIRVKQIIATLEEQLKERVEDPQSDEPLTGPGTIPTVQEEQVAIDAEIKRLTTDLAKVQAELPLYQQRIENTPKREQELLSISRDYSSTGELYASLLKRLYEANLADSLEQRQKAERFRLLEPAVYPQKPAGPNRIRLCLLGVALGLGAAAAGVLLWELLDTSFHRVEDLKAFTTVRILGSIPQIVTETECIQRLRWQSLEAVTLAIALVALAGVSYRVATGNETLVRLIVKPPSGMQLR
jgi:polysaccharide chain length determinant protein (PEP-CTERM system associated)